MSNFYNYNNNIDNLLNYTDIQNHKNYQHICFGCITLGIILYIAYDMILIQKQKQKQNQKKIQKQDITHTRGKACTSCNKKNIQTNNLILKYETENFKEIFNKNTTN